eukprot:1770384-Ditylum_brightwellii.AAC.1
MQMTDNTADNKKAAISDTGDKKKAAKNMTADKKKTAKHECNVDMNEYGVEEVEEHVRDEKVPVAFKMDTVDSSVPVVFSDKRLWR